MILHSLWMAHLISLYLCCTHYSYYPHTNIGYKKTRFGLLVL